MKKKYVAVLSLFTSFSYGSHHFESSLAKDNPKLDITDTYVFASPDKKHTVFSLSFNPNSSSENQIENLHSNGLYAIHIDDNNGKDVYIVKKGKGKINIYHNDKYEPNNPMGGASLIGKTSIGDETLLSNGVKVWIGAIKDPFFADAKGFSMFVTGIKKGSYDQNVIGDNPEFFQSRTTTGIVLEAPNQMFGDQVSVLSTSSIKMNGDDHWHQVNYSANALLTNLYLFDDDIKVLKNTEFSRDADIIVRKEIEKNIKKASKLSKSNVDDCYAKDVAKSLVPDVLRYRIGTDAKYSLSKPNGRSLIDDSFDEVLSKFTGLDVKDGYKINKNQQSRFPYFVAK
ncbi:hypothetical protein CWN98_09115 [Vibrio splendidus]|uniref:DUF4331 family protein n=1 Tax=Vibrio splendidus TaxID=29497 RepID=UPI000D36A635|nr:DUF4331 family protein [Vibrio splendidus]PTO87923.1 hypothetical protein CWN98_09115 [Vibrio splendidus]PTP46755.1 hypothetical protein CWO10_14805 [Vibrio splendidus]